MSATPVLYSIVTLLTMQACLQCQEPAQPKQTPPLQTAGEAYAKEADGPKDNTPPPLKPVPKLTEGEMDAFLKSAAIAERKVLELGTTKSEKMKLSDGKLSHDAHFQPVDVFKPVFRGAEGSIEKNFRDTWKFNVAAYRLSKLVNLDNVPMSVERDVDGKLGSMTWWVDNVWVTEAERRDRGIKPPAAQFWVDQLNTVRIFDQLICNIDRNQGNILITPDWHLWMIDHTRAFRVSPTLQAKNPLPGRIDQKLLQGLRSLTSAQLTKALSGYLRTEEIAAILKRRDLIIKHFESEIKENGEDSVLTGIPRKTPEVSLP